jgi:hypothetical protein
MEKIPHTRKICRTKFFWVRDDKVKLKELQKNKKNIDKIIYIKIILYKSALNTIMKNSFQ